MSKFTIDIVNYCEKTQTVLITKESLECLEERAKNEERLRSFALWVAREIFDDMWEFNEDVFAEIACRKLAKLGIVRNNGNVWEFINTYESEDEK